MAIGQGFVKQTRFKKQAAKGTIAGTSGGQIVRRTSSINQLNKETYDTSAEMVSHRQLVSVRHGVRSVSTAIEGIFSPATYAPIIESICARLYAAVTPTAAVSLTIAGAGPT